MTIINPGRRRWSGTLSGQITLVMMGIFLALSVILGVTWYIAATEWMTAAARERLDAVAQARGAAVDVQIARYLDALAGVAEPELGDLVRSLSDRADPLDSAARSALTAELNRQIRALNLDASARLFSLDGTARASSFNDLDNESQSPPLGRAAFRSPVVSAPLRIANQWHLDLTGPIADRAGVPSAVLRIRVVADALVAITGNARGLGHTGEIVLGRQQGEHLRFLLPLRFAPDPRSLDSLTISGSLATPMVRATNGESGESVSTDYRGVEVLAVYRPVPGTAWGLVVKQDMSEILGDAHRVRGALVLAMAALLAAALAAVFPLAQTMVRPLRNLERATYRVAGGDLSVEVPEAGTEELQALGVAFNTMVSHLQAAQAETLRHQEELESFSYIVSHDLKAPLRGINNLSQWLEEDVDTDLLTPKSRDHLRLLRDRVAVMNELIEGLLEFSRVGRVTQPDQVVRVEELVDSVLDVLDPPEGFRIDVVRPLPVVYAEPLRLTQVFQNLVGNALKHHPGPPGTVTIEGTETGHEFEFCVRDDGAGIDSRYHERIFGMFQVLERREGAGSTGIGLAIVKKIIEDRGGRIWVESEGLPGRGSAFTFAWPKDQKKERIT